MHQSVMITKKKNAKQQELKENMRTKQGARDYKMPLVP